MSGLNPGCSTGSLPILTDAIQSLGQSLKHDSTTSVVKVEENGQCWVIKRYNTKNPWHALRRTVRRSRAENCWRMSALLSAAGVRVPAPVAYMERRIGPLRGRSYFVYEYVDAEDLLTYMMTHTNTRRHRLCDTKGHRHFQGSVRFKN